MVSDDVRHQRTSKHSEGGNEGACNCEGGQH